LTAIFLAEVAVILAETLMVNVSWHQGHLRLNFAEERNCALLSTGFPHIGQFVIFSSAIVFCEYRFANHTANANVCNLSFDTLLEHYFETSIWQV